MFFMADSRLVVPNLTDSQKILSAIIENQVSMNTRVDNLSDVQKKHHSVLIEGNGEIPLVERIRNLEEFVNAMRYWLRFIGGALIIQTVAFSASIVVAVVKFLPILEKLARTP